MGISLMSTGMNVSKHAKMDTLVKALTEYVSNASLVVPNVTPTTTASPVKLDISKKPSMINLPAVVAILTVRSVKQTHVCCASTTCTFISMAKHVWINVMMPTTLTMITATSASYAQKNVLLVNPWIFVIHVEEASSWP
jgi:hypothetical protein